MRALVLVIAIALVLPSSAVADTTEETALAHLDRGIAAFNAKDFQRALGELTAAHELVPDKANPYRWLALTEIQLGNCPAALGHIDGFLARVPPEDARVAEMTRWRDFCHREAEKANQSPHVTGTQGLAGPPPPPADTPVTRRWWFWTAIGVAAVAATGAVIYVASDSPPATLPSIRCDASGCR
jgi:tetratricopeptide (TPR) repeat protein